MQHLATYVTQHVTLKTPRTGWRHRKNLQNLFLQFLIAMGRRSKASLARLHNLSKAPSRSYKATVEESPDSDADDTDYIVNDGTGSVNDTSSDTEGDDELNGIRGRFFTCEDDLDSDSDLDSVNGSDLEGMDLDDDEEVEIKNDAALLTFSAVLQEAQQTAVAAEKRKWGQRKRPKYYAGNSNRTLQRHALKRRKLESEGQSFISKWAHAVGTGTKSSASPDTFTCGEKQLVSVSHYSELILKSAIEESYSQP